MHAEPEPAKHSSAVRRPGAEGTQRALAASGAAAAYPSVSKQREAVEEERREARRGARGGGAARAASRAPSARSARLVEAAREHRRGQGLEVGLARQSRRAARAASRRRAAAAVASPPRLGANAIWARSMVTWARCELVERPGLALRPSRPSAASKAPACVLSRAPPRARGAPARAGSGVRAVARSRKAAAAASPPRACARSAERSSSRRPSSSSAGAACARCHARRSGSVPGSVASASAVWTLRRSSSRAASIDRGAHERVPEAHPGAELEQPVGDRGVRRVGADAERARPRATPATGSPSGSAAASSSRRRVSSGRPSSRCRKLSSIRALSAGAPGSPKPPASSAGVRPARQLEEGQRVAARLGDDPVAHARVQRRRG